jgi:hypothetical protein
MEDNLIDENILTFVCVGLVMTDEEWSIVRLVRAYLGSDVVSFGAHSPQITPCRGVSDASKIVYFQTLRRASQQHVSHHISHSTSLGEATALTRNLDLFLQTSAT